VFELARATLSTGGVGAGGGGLSSWTDGVDEAEGAGSVSVVKGGSAGGAALSPGLSAPVDSTALTGSGGEGEFFDRALAVTSGVVAACTVATRTAAATQMAMDRPSAPAT
jgi:hypothetical protein